MIPLELKLMINHKMSNKIVYGMEFKVPSHAKTQLLIIPFAFNVRTSLKLIFGWLSSPDTTTKHEKLDLWP